MEFVNDVWNVEIANFKPKTNKFFFENVFLNNISSWSCFHKHDIHNLIKMNIHKEQSVKAIQCQKCRKYIRKKHESWNACKKTLIFVFFLVWDFNISEIFYKIQFFPPVITHWTYTCQGPWALTLLIQWCKLSVYTN